MRGKYKLNTGGKPFAEWMAELNREDKELEGRKFQRLAALGKKSIIHHEGECHNQLRAVGPYQREQISKGV